MVILHSNHPLIVACEDCNADIRPQFKMTDAGLRRLPAYCECGFMMPQVVDDPEAAADAPGGNVEVEAA